MRRLFEIQTLSDYNRLGNGGGGVDPFTIITGSLAVLTGLFPGIFGGSRKRLTDRDWMTLFPGNGMWTVRLRNYLKNTIHYDTDWSNVEPFTRNFVYENMGAIPGANFTAKFKNFLEIIAEEKYTGGGSGGHIPGIPGTLDWSTLIPLALGAGLLIVIMKKKKKK